MRMQSLPGSLFPSPKRAWGRGYTYTRWLTSFSAISTQHCNQPHPYQILRMRDGLIKTSDHQHKDFRPNIL